MSRYLEVTVRIPIREEYEEDPKVINHIAGLVGIQHINVDDTVVIELDNSSYKDAILIPSLAHIKSAEVREIEPGRGYTDDLPPEEIPDEE